MAQINHQQLKEKLLVNPGFSRAYLKPNPAVEIGYRVKQMRLGAGWSQAELARRLNTKQSSIARLESGQSGLPSLSFLDKIAAALNARLVLPNFETIRASNRRAAETARVKG